MATQEQYKELSALQRRELLRTIQQQKISTLGLFMNQSDDFLVRVDAFPDDAFNDAGIMSRFLLSLDDRVKIYNDEMLTQQMSTLSIMIDLSYQHEQDYAQLNSIIWSPDEATKVSLLDSLRLPFSDDIATLEKAGIFIPPGSTIEAIGTNKVLGSQNRFNRMAELINQQPTEKQKELYQALANYINASDPLGNSVLTAIEFAGDVKPQKQYNLSNNIWGEDKRDEIYGKVLNDVKASKPPLTIKNELEAYLKESGQGNAFYKSERIVDTELMRSYVRSDLEAIREFNQNNPVKMYVVQRVSAAHRHKDECDDLEGVYDPGKGVPEIPRHPFCTCIQDRIFEFDLKTKPRDVSNITGNLI